MNSSLQRMQTFKEKDVKKIRLLVATLALVGATPSTFAQVGQSGRLLASNCFQCHGTNGRGAAFDPLAGLSASETYKKLKAMQSGKEGNGIMPRHSMTYTDAQLLQIADWFSRQK